MRRGFKANAEKKSLALREEIGINVKEPLDCYKLGNHLGITIVPLTKFQELGLSSSQLKLFGKDNGYKEFSATILDTPHGYLMIYNHFHSKARIKSSMAHETAHVVCDHKFSSVEYGFGLIREFPKEQEEEADWLAGCLVLPRNSIVWAVREGMNQSEMASHFGISPQMVRWRYNLTGIAKQVKKYNSVF